MESDKSEAQCHMGFTCNGCQRRNFPGRRFHCLACFEEFNLCNGCYALDVTTEDHKFDHAMHCILTPASMALFYTKDELRRGKLPVLIRCPYCKINNFNLEEFEQHLKELHPDADPGLLTCYKMNA
ncbi:uncharacterized protein Dana_GF15424 [Drosophila ananassae]|uniref:RING-type E3 ubiquitin transferase n=1 Tax=Drosophila ananassae TaxID=7217 RepID=B3MKL9_DROAN|nr:E3 ubiquitin-protein ligase KCMF1 [Drosophila ananassae]EDV31572.2 uncharacterized protein Dana_GF15424 [Drosophila ananassae]